MYHIEICPVKRLYAIAREADLQDCCAIVVSSYDIRQEQLQGLGRLLALHFDDIVSGGQGRAFGQEEADRVARFVRSLPAQLDTLFVCCDSGESRSSAMAAAILRAGGRDEMKIWENPHYHPNPLVYSLLSGALGVEAGPTEVEEKIAINREALSKAIKGKGE